VDERVASLSKVPLFRTLSQRQVRRILKGTLDYRYDAGKELVRLGEDGETLFVILEGRARVVRNRRTVARLRAGDFFGEIAVLDRRPRSASVVADTDVRCVVLHRDDLRKILAEEPRIAWSLLGTLASRVRGN
jgi:CRP-like cAMP-binding protein